MYKRGFSSIRKIVVFVFLVISIRLILIISHILDSTRYYSLLPDSGGNTPIDTTPSSAPALTFYRGKGFGGSRNFVVGGYHE